MRLNNTPNEQRLGRGMNHIIREAGVADIEALAELKLTTFRQLAEEAEAKAAGRAATSPVSHRPATTLALAADSNSICRRVNGMASSADAAGTSLRPIISIHPL